MLTAKTLNEAAGMLSTFHAHNTDSIAAELRAEAAALNGYGTRATLALVIVIDNDRAMVETRQRLVVEAVGNAEREISDMALVPEGPCPAPVEEARGPLADALRAQCDQWASDRWTELPSVASAMARCGLSAVDWMGLAAHYLDEYAADPYTVGG